MDSSNADEADLFDIDESGRTLRQWLYPDGQHPDASRASKLRNFFRELGVREFSFTFAFRCAGLADVRLELATRIAREDDKIGGI